MKPSFVTTIIDHRYITHMLNPQLQFLYDILAQDVTGYPTLKFFKSLEKSEKHRGGRDLDSLVAFIDEQMGRAPAKKEVSPLTQ